MWFAVCAKRWHDRNKPAWWNLSMPATVLAVTALLIAGGEVMEASSLWWSSPPCSGG